MAFGELQKGTLQQPSVTKESVHYLSKTVAGKPLRRPPWYFDVRQQGEGIVDVTMNLVDLVSGYWFLDGPRSASTLRGCKADNGRSR